METRKERSRWTAQCTERRSKGRSAKGKAGGLLTPRSTVQFQFTESSSDASGCTMNDESTYLAWPLARRSLAVATSQYHE